jgi:hypothetical protein
VRRLGFDPASKPAQEEVVGSDNDVDGLFAELGDDSAAATTAAATETSSAKLFAEDGDDDLLSEDGLFGSPKPSTKSTAGATKVSASQNLFGEPAVVTTATARTTSAKVPGGGLFDDSDSNSDSDGGLFE